MTFQRLTKAVAFLAVAAIAVRVSADTDTWWHLAAGRWMVDHGQLLRSDVFSFTRQGSPWVNPGWLAQLCLYASYRLAGMAGLNLLTAALAVGAFWILWPRLEGGHLLNAFVLILAASAAAIFWAARPHMFSFLLAAAYLAVLEDWRSDRRDRLWLLPPLMVLWANLHGGFAIGFLLIGAYGAGAAVQGTLTAAAPWRNRLASGWHGFRPLALVGLVTAVAVSFNPYGPGLLAYPFQTVSIGALQDYIQEWQSPNFHAAQVQPFAWLLLLVPVAMSLSRRPKHAAELALYVGFGYLSLAAARNIAIFALALAPVLSRHGAAALARLPARPAAKPLPPRLVTVTNWVLLMLLVIATQVWMAPRLNERFNQAAIEARLPVAAVDYLAERSPPGPLLHSYDWGGYLLWRLWPAYQSYVDGRTDLFGEDLLREYLQVWRADPGWQEVVARRGFQSALVAPSAPITLALQTQGWRVVFQDELAVVLQAPAASGQAETAK